MTRVYHFLPESFALDDIRQRRLKIARMMDLNDPFELRSMVLGPETWEAFENTATMVDGMWGVLCFSRGWSHPMLWSHYADRHCGVCLGFDVPDDTVTPIVYVAERMFLDPDRQLSDAGDPLMGLKFMTQKYEAWSYEDELRVFSTLLDQEIDSGMFFAEFSSKLVLREVITGVRSRLTPNVLSALLTPDFPDVTVTWTRLSSRDFAIVEDTNVQWRFCEKR